MQIPTRREDNTLFAGIFFLAFSILIFELALIRLVSVAMFSHMAFLGITIAFYGITMGGIIVYFFPRYFSPENFEKRLRTITLFYALSLVIFIFLFLRFDFSAIHFGSFLFVFLLSATPFVLANICLSLIFKTKSEIMGKLYFFDLVGAALGVLFAVLLMTFFSTINVVLWAAAAGATATIFFGIRRLRWVGTGGFMVIFLLGGIMMNQTHHYLDIVWSKKGRETDVVFSKWNSFSRVAVRDEKQPRVVASLPSPFNDLVTEQLGIEIDAGAYTPVLKFNGNLKDVGYLRDDLSNLAFRITEPGNVLIIGPGGGRDVLGARLFGHRVTGVEINPIIVNDIMRGFLKSYSGDLYSLPEIDIKVAEGRSFIHNDRHTYRVISLPLVDTWASTSAGNLVLVESNLYTVEAFEDYLGRLEENGILTISRWELDGMRLVSLFLEASKRMGIEHPEHNIVVVKNQTEGDEALNNYLFKITAFKERELAAIEEYSRETGFPIVYTPNQALDTPYYTYLTADDRDVFLKTYHRNIKAVYDESPFFFFTIHLNTLLGPPFSIWWQGGGLVLAFTVALLLTTLSVFLPLLIGVKNTRIETGPSLQYLGYFGALGIAFMFLEMALIQKFILYLERPIFSYSVVLVVLLFFAGVGSFLTKTLDPLRARTLVILSLAFPALVTILVLALGPLFSLTIGWPLAVKILIAALVHIPLALLMGTMLPLGIRRLHRSGMDSLIPWCWAINGATSVLASVLAILLAIILGFNAVLLTGGIVYLGAGLFLILTRKTTDVALNP